MNANRQQRRADAARVRHLPFGKDYLVAVVYWCHYRLLGKSTYPDAAVDGKPLHWVSEHASKLTAMLRDETAHDWDEAELWPRLVELSKSTPLQMKYRAQAHWFELAMPRVSMDAKLAASLMCMKVSQAILADFRPPFDSIQITIPPDLIFMARPDGTLVPVTRALFARVTDDSGLLNWCLFADADDATGSGTLHRWNVEVGVIAGCLPWDGTERSAPDPFSADLQDTDRRSQDLLGVLAINVCLMMQDKRYVQETRCLHAPSKRRRGPPASRHFKLTRPVMHDMRKAVVEYGKQGGKSPTVQCVVAGHWKMQPCGPGGTERKRIFIEPYWRGPEDAPIALRPHVLGRSGGGAVP